MSSPRERLLAQFRELVVERLARVGNGLVALEAGPDAEAGRAALRELHGLKGEARMMGFGEVNTVVHQMEELVRAVEGRGFALQAGSVDALMAAAAAVTVLAGAGPGEAPDVAQVVRWLGQCTQAERGEAARPPDPVASSPSGVSTPAEKPASPARVRAVEHSIRISHKSLERLTANANGLQHLLHRRRVTDSQRFQLAWELRQLHRLAEDLGQGAQALAARLGRAKEAASELARLEGAFAAEEARELAVLHDEVQALRMVRLEVLFESYPRMVRELARELGREVELLVEGENEHLDRAVLDAVAEPLLHLVRNALDHGLEPRAEREAAGKPGKGTLRLSAVRQGDHLALVVADDGRGLDASALRAAAVRQGVVDEARAQALPDDAVFDLIFLPGFSSRTEVTEVSGRGVGLDAVRTRVVAVGGEVTLATTAGRGTTFTLRVPLSLSVAPVLFVRVGAEQLCLPASAVESAVSLGPGELREVAGRPMVAVGGEVMPWLPLAALLGLGPEAPPAEGQLVLVLKGRGLRAAVGVDRVLDEREQAILPLRGVLATFPHLSGATQVGDGSLALVLSASHLVAVAHGRETRLAQRPGREGPQRRRVLVVDDSPLTRELLVSLLEASGYAVTQAVDGEEALTRLERDPVDCVVTDLEMPRLDGLGLTRRLKAHPLLGKVPVIIITTRGSAADRQLGLEAGADAYVAKGDLVRQDLVDIVGRMLA